MKAAMQGRVECVKALMLAGTRASDHCEKELPGNCNINQLLHD